MKGNAIQTVLSYLTLQHNGIIDCIAKVTVFSLSLHIVVNTEDNILEGMDKKETGFLFLVSDKKMPREGKRKNFSHNKTRIILF